MSLQFNHIDQNSTSREGAGNLPYMRIGRQLLNYHHEMTPSAVYTTTLVLVSSSHTRSQSYSEYSKFVKLLTLSHVSLFIGCELQRIFIISSYIADSYAGLSCTAVIDCLAATDSSMLTSC